MNLELIRAFFTVLECGSINKAAERLRISQSTLTRQLQSLEADIGTAILERSTRGVAATGTGQLLRERMEPLVDAFDKASQEVLNFARGQRTSLKIGYIASAASTFLNTALASLRQEHPDTKLTLFDMSPGEQILALKAGSIDIAMLGHAGTLVTEDFYTRKIASLPVYVALSESNPLSQNETLQIADLSKESFIGAPESDMPGIKTWITSLCKSAGFRARFLHDGESLSHTLSSVVSENAVTLVPEHVRSQPTPGVVFKKIAADSVRWDFYVAWERGKTADAIKTLLTHIATP